MINIITIAKDGHNPELIAKLLPVWERSVRATHTFLSNIEHYDVQTLAVNEQNPQAHGFYEHMGFKRTELDEQGQPYPLLYMRHEV